MLPRKIASWTSQGFVYGLCLELLSGLMLVLEQLSAVVFFVGEVCGSRCPRGQYCLLHSVSQCTVVSEVGMLAGRE